MAGSGRTQGRNRVVSGRRRVGTEGPCDRTGQVRSYQLWPQRVA